MEQVERYISKMWNEINTSTYMVEENFWDMCRILEKEGFLVADDAAVSTISIGPFRIASTIDIKRRDIFIYFLKVIVPIIFSKANGLPFDQVYSLYILPAVELLINLADNCCWIKDLLQWDVLMYVKKDNQRGIYPTVNDIKKSKEFIGFEEWQIEEAIKQLKSVGNVLGDHHELIGMDFEGRIECLV